MKGIEENRPCERLAAYSLYAKLQNKQYPKLAPFLLQRDLLSAMNSKSPHWKELDNGLGSREKDIGGGGKTG